MIIKKYWVELVDGAVVVRHTANYAGPMTPDEARAIQEMLAIAGQLKGAAWHRQRHFTVSDVRPDGYVYKMGRKHEISEIVDQLTELQARRSVVNRQVTELLGKHATTLTNYKQGRSRPLIEDLLIWAWVLQEDIMLVPFAIRDKVKALVKEWRERDMSPEGTGSEAEDEACAD